MAVLLSVCILQQLPIVLTSLRLPSLLVFNYQFIGFHDGTVVLMKLESSPRQDIYSSEPKLNKNHFSIMWEIQFTYPVIGLSFGNLLGFNDQQSYTKLNDSEKPLRNVKVSVSATDNHESTETLADQLAVVTTKSFHLFSLSLSIPPVMES